MAREQPQDVSPHRALADIALYEGRPDEFLREAATTARLRTDAPGLAEVERWRSSGSLGIGEAMLRDAMKTGADWFRIATLAAVTSQPDLAKDALARACNTHEPVAISAPSNLWLSRALTPTDIAERCGRAAPLS